jgi:PhzF family phenazine biosynthesis protein
MKLTLYQLDAFTDRLFGGNPAAVVPLENWIDDEFMQQIALENNLSETAFFVPSKSSPNVFGDKQNFNEDDFQIRWFTPGSEINLCGHATLASAYVLFNFLNFNKEEIVFSCKSGVLKVKMQDSKIWLDFPSWKPSRFADYPEIVAKALGNPEIVSVYQHRDLLVELVNEDAVKNCSPDFSLINKSGYKIIITAPGTNADFVSRFFAPSVGVDEDPVTGSSHSQLIPFWSEKLNKEKLFALQLSKRGGKIWCEQNGDRVRMGGDCVYYMKGEIEIK